MKLADNETQRKQIKCSLSRWSNYTLSKTSEANNLKVTIGLKH